MNSNLVCAENENKSSIDRIINSAHSQNIKQQAIESRLGALLDQLRGAHPVGNGCAVSTEVIEGALPVLESAVSRHRELNDSILDQVAELESLLTF
jgi:hypothetical protein|nr:MAG TPA: hypothetical protein [Caudoviricetes sp.]